jgi:hypothetical protein
MWGKLMSKDKLTFAIDFDGCLTEYNFPEIGEQTKEQKELLDVLIRLKEDGHKLILWTSRGELALQEAIEWCTDHKLEFDDINVNPFFDKKSGSSPKIVADYYIDDKALEFKSLESRQRTIEVLKGLI